MVEPEKAGTQAWGVATGLRSEVRTWFPDCVEVDISPTTSPALFQLSGTVFGVGSGNLAPSVTSTASTNGTIGQPMSFSVTTSGFLQPQR